MQTKTIVVAALAVLVATAGVVTAAPGATPDGIAVGSDDAQDDDHRNDSADDARADGDPTDSDDAEGTADEREAGSVAGSDGPPADVPAGGASNGAADEKRPGDAASPGPPTDLPAQVPEFVSELHRIIVDFLGGDLAGSLGDAVSDLTPGDGDDGSDRNDDAGANESAVGGTPALNG